MSESIFDGMNSYERSLLRTNRMSACKRHKCRNTKAWLEKRIVDLETMLGHQDIKVVRVDGDRNGEGLPESFVLKRGGLYRTYEATSGSIEEQDND